MTEHAPGRTTSTVLRARSADSPNGWLAAHVGRAAAPALLQRRPAALNPHVSVLAATARRGTDTCFDLPISIPVSVVGLHARGNWGGTGGQKGKGRALTKVCGGRREPHGHRQRRRPPHPTGRAPRARHRRARCGRGPGRRLAHLARVTSASAHLHKTEPAVDHASLETPRQQGTDMSHGEAGGETATQSPTVGATPINRDVPAGNRPGGVASLASAGQAPSDG